jgi:hypothetical protein
LGEGVEVEFVRSVARRMVGSFAPGVAVETGATVRVEDCYFEDNGSVSLQALGAGATAIVERSIFETARPSGDATVASGVTVLQGATLQMRDSVIRNTADFGVSVQHETSSARLTGVTIDTIESIFDAHSGFGALVRNAGSATFEGCTIRANRNAGLFVGRDASGDVRRSAVLSNDNRDGGLYGMGIISAGALRIEDSVIADNETAGLIVTEAASTARVERSRIDQTAKTDDEHGHGVMVSIGELVVNDSHISNSAGVGVVIDRARATLSGTYVLSNAVGIHVQGGTALVERDTVPAEPVDGEAVVATDCVFSDNATKIGSGTIPVPMWTGEL